MLLILRLLTPKVEIDLVVVVDCVVVKDCTTTSPVTDKRIYRPHKNKRLVDRIIIIMLEKFRWYYVRSVWLCFLVKKNVVVQLLILSVLLSLILYFFATLVHLKLMTIDGCVTTKINNKGILGMKKKVDIFCETSSNKSQSNS
jgi:hypothetical protein